VAGPAEQREEGAAQLVAVLVEAEALDLQTHQPEVWSVRQSYTQTER
jgi:hypothetical protein